MKSGGFRTLQYQRAVPGQETRSRSRPHSCHSTRRAVGSAIFLPTNVSSFWKRCPKDPQIRCASTPSEKKTARGKRFWPEKRISSRLFVENRGDRFTRRDNHFAIFTGALPVGLGRGPRKGSAFLCGSVELVHRLLATFGDNRFERVGGAFENLFKFLQFVRAKFGENEIHDNLLPFRLAQRAGGGRR